MECILTNLAEKILFIKKVLQKPNNTIAQSSPFVLRGLPIGDITEYLRFLCVTSLRENYFLLIEAVRIFEIVSYTRPAIIDDCTIHMIFACCCLLVGKFYYDDYNSTGFEQLLGVKKDKLNTMETVLFIDILLCS